MNILADFKWGGIAIILITIVAVSYHMGGNTARSTLQTERAAQLAAVVKTYEDREKSRAAQVVTNTQAEATHDNEIDSLPLRTLTAPVFVRSAAADCPAVTVSIPAEARSQHSPGGAVESGLGERDIRPALEAVKLKYETVLADCRRMSAEWPK